MKPFGRGKDKDAAGGEGSRQEPQLGADREFEQIESTRHQGDVGTATVEGERGIPSVNRAQTVQSRINNWLALGLMLFLGGGFLVWYYSAQFQRADAAQAADAKARATRAGGEMKLPRLGPVDAPRSVGTDTTTAPDAGPTVIGDVLGPPPALPDPGAMRTVGTQAPPVAAAPAGPKPPTQAELDLARKLGVPVMYRSQAGAASAGGALPAASSAGQSGAGALAAGNSGGGVFSASGGVPQEAGSAGPGSIGALLQPTSTPAVRAQMLPTRRFLLGKGAFVDCTLETALDSTLPGMTTCITAFDIFGADGKVVLMERGTKLVGETKGEIRRGQGRIFVLWSEARTPHGVVVPLASPGTDELGRSGLPGWVDTHFWERFGAAILISVIDGVIQAGVLSQSGGGNGGPALIYNPQNSQSVATEILKNTINIPPTVIKNQGDRIQVFVARDADFRPVYDLRMAATGGAESTAATVTPGRRP